MSKRFREPFLSSICFWIVLLAFPLYLRKEVSAYEKKSEAKVKVAAPGKMLVPTTKAVSRESGIGYKPFVPTIV